VLWVRHSHLPRLIMDRLFNKKSKKSLKSSPRHISLGIPTNTAIGPLGFRVELDIGPKGERGPSRFRFRSRSSDSLTATPVTRRGRD